MGLFSSKFLISDPSVSLFGISPHKTLVLVQYKPVAIKTMASQRGEVN
jgi:hypothetical protein